MAIERWGSPSATDHNDTASLTAGIALFGRQPAGEKQEEHFQPVGVYQIVGCHSKSDPAVEQVNRVTEQNEKRHHVGYIRLSDNAYWTWIKVKGAR